MKNSQEKRCLTWICHHMTWTRQARYSRHVARNICFLLLSGSTCAMLLAAPSPPQPTSTLVAPLAVTHMAQGGELLPPASAPTPVALALDPGTATPQAMTSRNAHIVYNQNIGSYNFGKVDLLSVSRTDHTFILHNTGKTSITIERLQPSCGCTSATLEAASASSTSPVAQYRNDSVASREEALPLVLAPDQQVLVHVTVNFEDHAVGPLTKSVAVYVHGQPQPAAVMEMSGILLQSIAFSPTLLDFGSVGAGEARSLPLTVTLDARFTLTGAWPTLISTNPAIRISLAPETTPYGALSHASNTHVRNYLLTLAPNAPLGPLSGSIRFELPNTSAPVRDASLASHLADSEALITGEVKGDVSAFPQEIAFGTVEHGDTPRRQIVLTGSTPTSLRGAMVESTGPWLSASIIGPSPEALLSAGGQSPAPTQVLLITLSPQAPNGSLQTQLLLKLGNGRQMLLPVSAQLIPARTAY